jgi:hypothetical protein
VNYPSSKDSNAETHKGIQINAGLHADKNKGKLSQDIVDTLKECAEDLHRVDERLAKVRHQVLNDENEYSNY